jgi:anti-sigma regulatory factor (Ser/Thr protein kinase)
MARLLVVRQCPDDDEVLAHLPGLDALHVEHVTGIQAALQRLADKPFDVLLLSPASSVDEDLAFLGRARELRPGIRPIVLADAATPDRVIAAMRAEVFAVFTRPFDPGQIADLVVKAAAADDTHEHGIRVLSAAPHWITLQVSAQLVTADRVVAFMDQLHKRLFDGPEMDQLLMAFREILLNAVEHGAGLDPDRDVRVDAIRTRRALTFYVRDPGPGFSTGALTHAASDDDPLAHMRRRQQAGLRPGGYGMLMSRKLVDEVIYSHAGNEVLIVKYLDEGA